MYNIIASLVIGYLFGCMCTAYIVGKAYKNLDVRDYGSGNAGTTNAIRVLGWKAGIITFIGDFLKAIIAVNLAKFVLDGDPKIIAVYAAIGVILGHDWPVFLGFRGGKGIAATIGVLMALNYQIGLICAVLMICVIYLTRYVSLAAILTSLLAPILFMLLDYSISNMIFAVTLTVVNIFQHRSNIGRLLRGEESKIGKRVEIKKDKE